MAEASCSVFNPDILFYATELSVALDPSDTKQIYMLTYLNVSLSA